MPDNGRCPRPSGLANLACLYGVTYMLLYNSAVAQEGHRDSAEAMGRLREAQKLRGARGEKPARREMKERTDGVNPRDFKENGKKDPR